MRPSFRRPAPAAARLLGLCCAVASPLLAQQGEEARERWQRVGDVVAALGIGEGSVVADVGAGGGFFTVRLARAVGATGRVYAVDIDAGVVARLEARRAPEGWSNVTVIHSIPDDPRLPAGTLDAVLVVNAYHEFTAPDTMLAAFRRALKPDGRLVLVDQTPPASRLGAPRPRQERGHDLGSWFAAGDVRRAGFEILRLEDPFIRRDQRTGAQSDWWILVARPPSAAETGQRR
ncbi:MAG: methyltransferase domain-containing protein [Gemmatimonadetes bacterium]|nr:methyltransferase domain-containing protein [Gemmatimonadota bacterium]